ncbi:ethylmalonyl-CoA decarboxylase-like [Sitophilus oryzae]|uniref:Ethylmalonyl-CoA decarboxylase-like n=1 Tax=Sitophilus oryzae TaxID=7048 RepID=A0A6J2XR27_SITOR|nr:ethylmalonyl-CoA decarboxylase-like [Sitophilus oryzae]
MTSNTSSELLCLSEDMNDMLSYMGQYGSGEIFISKEFWQEGIAVINISNPEKRNAISGKMLVDFHSCISELEHWPKGKAVILQGLHTNFCSGCDLDFARTCNTPKDAFYLSYLMGNILERLTKLPLISVALLHGPALGGGGEIALACDHLVVAEDVKFGLVQGKMGIITVWGGTTRLVNKIGQQKALHLLLSARILNAKECIDIGLAIKSVKSEDRFDEVLRWTREHTHLDVSVVRAYKKASVLNLENIDSLLVKERKLGVPLWGGPVNKEALERRIKHIPNKS